MTAPAAIAGTFADLKVIKSRSVVQIVVEIPIEDGAAAIEAFGFPQPGAEIAVAVARLNPPLAPGKGSDEQRSASAIAGTKPRSRAQMAGSMCGNRKFQIYLNRVHRYGAPGDEPDPGNAAYAADAVRELCKVKSRSEFDSDLRAGLRWDSLYNDFLIWRDHPELVEGRNNG